MLETELQQLRDDNTAIAELVTRAGGPLGTAAPARAAVSGHGRCDGPAEPGLRDGENGRKHEADDPRQDPTAHARNRLLAARRGRISKNQAGGVNFVARPG